MTVEIGTLPLPLRSMEGRSALNRETLDRYQQGQPNRDAGSFNGRTTDFESVYVGSIPSPATMLGYSNGKKLDCESSYPGSIPGPSTNLVLPHQPEGRNVYTQRCYRANEPKQRNVDSAQFGIASKRNERLVRWS